MDRWVGKVAVVTGAASGIGAAITLDLLRAGVIVVGLDKNVKAVEELRHKVPPNLASALHPRECNVSHEASIVDAFAWIDSNLGGVEILVNNAATFHAGQLLDGGNTEWLRSALDTNVLGMVLCTREACHSMKRRNAAGHVVLINSLFGHAVPIMPPGVGSMNIYPATKHATTAVAEVLRQEFNRAETKIKITVSAMPDGFRI